MGLFESKGSRAMRRYLETQKKEEPRELSEEEKNKEFNLKVIFYKATLDKKKVEKLRELNKIEDVTWHFQNYELNVTLNTSLKEIYEQLEKVAGFSKKKQSLYSFYDDLSFHGDDESLYSIIEKQVDKEEKYKNLYFYNKDELYEVNIKTNYINSEIYKVKIHDSMKIESILEIAIRRGDMEHEDPRHIRYNIVVDDCIINRDKNAIFYDLRKNKNLFLDGESIKG